jgi:hypothetical protein
MPRTADEKGRRRAELHGQVEAAMEPLKNKSAVQFDVPKQEAIIEFALAQMLEDAIQDLVDSTDGNTETMAALQKKIVKLTETYVSLQRWIVALTVAAVAAAGLGAGAAAVQAYRAWRPLSPAVVVQPVPVTVMVVLPSPAPKGSPPPIRNRR